MADRSRRDGREAHRARSAAGRAPASLPAQLRERRGAARYFDSVASVDETQDRVAERRRAAALARHYRDQESLSIAEIARRLGRAPATVKAYLYDPS